MLDEDKISVIDAGGGDDSLKVIHAFVEQDLVAETLFIIPYMPDFVQLINLVDTYNVLPDTAKILVVLNNADLSNPDHLMFVKGNEDFEIPDISSTFAHFAVFALKAHFFLMPLHAIKRLSKILPYSQANITKMKYLVCEDKNQKR